MNYNLPAPKFALCFRNRPIVPSMVVIKAICEHFQKMNEAYNVKRPSDLYLEINVTNIRKAYRGKYHVMCRTFISHYLYHYCDWTMQIIGFYFNGRDHTTVVHGLKIFEEQVTGKWDNEHKEHFSVLKPLMKRPTFPKYDIDSFYEKHNVVKIKPRSSKRRDRVIV